MKPQEAVKEFQKDYDETVRRLKAEVQKQIKAGVPPDQAVTKAIKETGMMAAITKGVEKAISDSYESPAFSISDHGGNPFDHWQAGDMKLSEVIHGAGIQIKQTIAMAIKQAQKEGSAIRKTARLLYDGYGHGHITKRQKLPEYLEQLLSDVDEAASGADVAKDEAMKAVIKDVKKAARNVSRLSGMTNGSMNLKTAYKALLKALEMFDDKLVENTARTAIEEKSRYIADRIARTEAARAYAQSTFDKYANDKDIVAYKWTLSSRHPCDDICDLYANADLYGMGKGVFPKDKFPVLPVHPNCLCHMTPMHRAELDNLTPVKDPLKAGEEYLETARPNVLKRILGVNGAADFKAGSVKWWDVAREYKTEYMKESSFLKDVTEKSRKITNPIYDVNWDVIKSPEYKALFSTISDNPVLNETIYKKAMDMFEHRTGTDKEDLYLIDRFTGKVVASSTHSEEALTTYYNSEVKAEIKKGAGNLISIHNHPNSIPPGGYDISSSARYYCGMVFCHDGTFYQYKMGKRKFSHNLFDMVIGKFKKEGYNEVEAGEMALRQFEKDYGLKWRKWSL